MKNTKINFLNSQEKLSNSTYIELIQNVDHIRRNANRTLNPDRKNSLGQFFTSGQVAKYMASLFDNIEGDINLLDPGAGVGSLTAAFVHELLHRDTTKKFSITTYEIEYEIHGFLNQTIKLIQEALLLKNITIDYKTHPIDFILDSVNLLGSIHTKDEPEKFSHIIMNPPYKKINALSKHHKALKKIGLNGVNLYSSFVALAIKLLKPNGELVAILPRSFCNGPYYINFRKTLLNETTIKSIHLIDRRDKVFSDDQVLQENIIIHCKKGNEQGDVSITSNPIFDFNDFKSKIEINKKNTISVPFNKIVDPNNNQKFIRIISSNEDQITLDRISVFKSSLTELNLNVSTGPVVDFRLKKNLLNRMEKDSVPLLYPVHLNGGLTWPINSKKPNAISIDENSIRCLWKQMGHFVITKRFSSKEERRRIVAYYYDSVLPGDLIGFDNKLNIFHFNKQGFEKNVAKGLFIFLNSTLLDRFYRLFGGHTQVNVSDLKSFPYPSLKSLKRMGKSLKDIDITQNEIDVLLEDEISKIA